MPRESNQSESTKVEATHLNPPQVEAPQVEATQAETDRDELNRDADGFGNYLILNLLSKDNVDDSDKASDTLDYEITETELEAIAIKLLDDSNEKLQSSHARIRDLVARIDREEVSNVGG